MDKTVNWGSFVKPLDFNQLYGPLASIKKLVTFKPDLHGIDFYCETSKWGEDIPIHLRMDVISDNVIRVRMRQNQLKEITSEMLVNKSFPKPSFHVVDNDQSLLLRTKSLMIEIIREPWQIKVFDLQKCADAFFVQQIHDKCYGPAFEVPPIGFSEIDGKLSVHESIRVHPGEAFYGFGEHFSSINKWGQTINSWAVDSGNVSSKRSYKNIPFLISSQGYGIFVHSSSPMQFQMGSESSISYSFHVLDDQLDYFLIYGPKFSQVIKQYCDLTGYAPVPPKWSFGLWISRCGYKNQTEVEDIVRKFRELKLPCDVISLDPWWMGNGPWSTYEWDRNSFPKPEEMMGWLKRHGIRTCLWIHPYIPKNTKLYHDSKEKGFLVKKPDGTPSPVIEPFSGEELFAIDFTNNKANRWFQEKIKSLLQNGVSVFKTDFGEQAPVDAIYSDQRTGIEAHNIYPLLYNKTVFVVTEKHHGRGLVWGRSGYAGSQRYPIQWGGDSYACFDQMACQLQGLLSYSMSGVPFCSHDVGGFDFPPQSFYDENQENTPLDPELYVRWLQFGVFSSHLRAHGKQAREPWAYGDEALEIARKYLSLRYRLLPYIFSQAVKSCKTGLPMVRPMVLEYQEDLNTRNLDQQYMFGDAFLVAPVITKKNRIDVYLPKGIWIDFWSKEIVEGGGWITVNNDLEFLPLWVKGGSVIPLGPEMLYVGQKELDPLTLEFYPPFKSISMAIHDEGKKPINLESKYDFQTINIELSPTPGLVEIVLFDKISEKTFVDSTKVKIDHMVNGTSIKTNGKSGVILYIELEKNNDH